MIDYYKILGLPYNANTNDIKSAYRKLSKKFHPDLNQGDKFFEDKFKEIQEAYENLTNKDYVESFMKFKNIKNSSSSNTNNQKASNTKDDKTNNEPIKQKDKKNIFKENLISIITVIGISIAIGLVKTNMQNSIRENTQEELLKNYSPPAIEEDNTLVSHNEDFQDVNAEAIATAKLEIQSTSKDSISNNSSKIENDENTATKIETENWILQKLNANTPSKYYVSLNSGYNDLTPISGFYRKNFTYEFTKYNLVIKYQEEKDSETKYFKSEIPIYDIDRVYYHTGSLWITTIKQTIIENNYQTNKRNVSGSFYTDFENNSETDIIERLSTAFIHLKKFYKKPISNEPF
jgi:curved DNA-binding protein CbpA